MRPRRPGWPALALLLLPGCFPYYRQDPGLARERQELLSLEIERPEDPRYPQARYAVCLRLAETAVHESKSPLPLSDRVQNRVTSESGRNPACCLGGLAFAADVLVVAPLRFLRTVFTLPVAWVRRSSWRREAEEARTRWMALDPAAAP